MTTPSLPPLREVVARHGIAARRGLGQHFLFDLNLTGRIARTAGPLAGKTVIEVGPGPGGLTRALLDAGAERLVVIERDSRCIDALREIAAAYPNRLEILEGDALEIRAATLGPAPRVIVSNLPYNISTVLLRGWLDELDAIESMTLMFQREVARRLAAPPGGKDYGRLSVLTQWLCEVSLAFSLPAAAFTPPPKIDSSVVRFIPRAVPLAPARKDILEKTTAAAFGQRRKMLRASLRGLGGGAEALLADAGIDPTRRAETLSVVEFCALARALERRDGA
ncbi:MAG: 16S rRNA (adenine(1518)-N(6)/adenine(1519)-N(6))-dimethyltransferase RsmA [Alphaproteobacteria bacterium]